MQTKKVIIRKKRGRQFDYQEIEIPTDAAMIEVVQRFQGQAEAQIVDVDGWRVRYHPPRPIFAGPARDLFTEGELLGPMEQKGKPFAMCTITNSAYAAALFCLWDEGDTVPKKILSTKGILEGRPIVIQEDLLTWHATSRPHIASPDEDVLIAPEIDDELHEGARIRAYGDRYERDPAARMACIEHYGATCVVCGFNFATTYGDAAAGFIHVHHLRPLSTLGDDHIVDPVADLRPLCPNCHSFVHLEEPPLEVEKARGVVDVIRMLQSGYGS